MAFWNRKGSEAARPRLSLPANGCPPIHHAPGRTARVASSVMMALVLPTSERMVPGLSAGPTMGMSSRIRLMGVARMTASQLVMASGSSS
jgi:hypothetical protein